MDNLMYLSSILGGILLAGSLIWVAIYNLRISETRKATLFLICGLSIVLILIYSILFNH